MRIEDQPNLGLSLEQIMGKGDRWMPLPAEERQQISALARKAAYLPVSLKDAVALMGSEGFSGVYWFVTLHSEHIAKGLGMSQEQYLRELPGYPLPDETPEQTPVIVDSRISADYLIETFSIMASNDQKKLLAETLEKDRDVNKHPEFIHMTFGSLWDERAYRPATLRELVFAIMHNPSLPGTNGILVPLSEKANKASMYARVKSGPRMGIQARFFPNGQFFRSDIPYVKK